MSMYLQYCAQCDFLVTFGRRAGVKYLSFQWTQHHNESFGREGKGKDSYGPQENTTIAYQAFH